MTQRQDAPAGFRDFIGALVQHEVDFVVCGGVACVLHGVSRVTADLDIAVDMSTANLRRLIQAAESLHLQPRMPEPLGAILDERRRQEWIDQKGAIVLTLTSAHTPLQLDVFLHYPIRFDELKSRASRMNAGGVSFLASSREDLVRAKQAVTPMRRVDERDIQDLQEMIARDGSRKQSR